MPYITGNMTQKASMSILSPKERDILFGIYVMLGSLLAMAFIRDICHISKVTKTDNYALNWRGHYKSPGVRSNAGFYLLPALK